jgi:predicted ferric reductase
LPLRQQAYEVFLVAHKVLAIVALVGYFLHIYYLYEYNWGYEIWVYAAGGIWFADRLLRVLRIARNGIRTATVTSLGEDSDLLKVEIDGVVAEGHVYLYFPTLSWRFYESHPFSVLRSFGREQQPVTPTQIESRGRNDEKTPYLAGTEASTSTEGSVHATVTHIGITPRATLLLRPEKGITRTLLNKTKAAGGRLSLPVLIESSYHSQKLSALKHCTTLIAIAGGVGITAILPLAQSFSGPVARLYWGVKHDDIVRGVAPELDQLRKTVNVEVKVGERFDVEAIVREEMLSSEHGGDIAVVVCGPAEMADAVRRAVGGASRRSKRGVVFIDEAFSW